MTLALTGQHTFIGVLRPLPNPFTLYLRIFRSDEGVLMAAFRNPEQNSHGPAMQYRVERDRDDLKFTAGADSAAPDNRLEAKYLSGADASESTGPKAAARSISSVARRREAAKFFPRPPGGAPYVYREPAVTTDGWETARGRELGLDEAAITRMVQTVIDGDPAARRPSLIHSLLVAYRGKARRRGVFLRPRTATSRMIFGPRERHFRPCCSALAMMDGVKIGPDTKVYALMPDLEPFANPDPRKVEITLAHLMTHSAGLACNDYDEASPGNEDTMQWQREQPDWWKYTLDLPMAHDPGKRYAYCSANINLVGGALTTRDEDLAAGTVPAEGRRATGFRRLALEPDAERRGLSRRRRLPAAARPAESRPGVSRRRRLERPPDRQCRMGQAVHRAAHEDHAGDDRPHRGGIRRSAIPKAKTRSHGI